MKIKKILRLSAEDSGGRNRTRTCDPIDVNDVLSARRTKCRTPHDCLQIVGKPYFTGNSEFFCFWTSVFKLGKRCIHF